MAETLGYLVIIAVFLHLVGVVDIAIDVSSHVAGEKVICIRGKEG